MSRYMTPLPGMLAAAIEFVLGQAASLDPDPAAKLEPLEGRWLKFALEGLQIDLWLSAEGERFRVLAEPEEESLEADTEISGSPGGLLAMAFPVIVSEGLEVFLGFLCAFLGVLGLVRCVVGGTEHLGSTAVTSVLMLISLIITQGCS
mgnify:CR=1 FL=1